MKTKRKRVAAAAITTAAAMLTGVVGGPASAVVASPAIIGTTGDFVAADTTATTTQWAASAASQALKGDYNGDGRDDLYMYGPGTATDQLWLSKPLGGADGDRFTVIASSISGTYQPIVGDFDGNGADDIFWYAPGAGADSIWFYSTTTAGAFVSQPRTVGGTYTPIVGDFDTSSNGSGPSQDADDIFWYNAKGAEFMWTNNVNKTFVSRSFETSVPAGAQVLKGNFIGSSFTIGTDDLFFYIPGTGQDAIWESNSSGSFSVTNKTINGTYTPVVGTFHQGDPGLVAGLADILWYAPGTKADNVWMNQNNGSFASVAATINGTYKPFVIPGLAKPDAIAWNNPTGSDSIWAPKGAAGSWQYQSMPFVTPDQGARTPIVGTFDDAARSVLDIFWRGPIPPLTPTTTVTARVPSSDIMWVNPGSSAALTEVFTAGTSIDVSYEVRS